MHAIHILTYVFVFTLGGAAVDLFRCAVKLAARHRTARLTLDRLVDRAMLRLDIERAPYLEAAHREVAEMFWETSSLGKPAPTEAARLEHGAVTGCSNPACLGGHAPNESAVPEPRMPGAVVIDGHTLPAENDERWKFEWPNRVVFRAPDVTLLVFDSGAVYLCGNEWFKHKDVKPYRDRIADWTRVIAEREKTAALNAAITDLKQT